MSNRTNLRHRGARFLTLLLFVASAAGAATTDGQLRLDPKDIEALSKSGAGTGTSGVAGIQTTVLLGDPAATGPYTIALRAPAHTVIAPHTHRDSRSAVVVSGTWWFGYGAVNTPDKLKALTPGSFYTEPSGRAHFARTGDEAAVVYITGIGPSDTHYLDASGDPQRP
jgi:quercetin dioxygenase-like cupin family protein